MVTVDSTAIIRVGLQGRAEWVATNGFVFVCRTHTVATFVTGYMNVSKGCV
jgi:hypothetical protein